MTGRFLTLEGGEGAGKTTLALGLVQHLSAVGIDAVRTREPGGTPGADEIRSLLVTGATARWSALTEALLFSAARNDHLEHVIRPALARGDWVVCDRFTDSTRAYQSAAGGVSTRILETLEVVIGAPAPDLTFVLDLDPAAGLGRTQSGHAGEGRFEAKSLAFHQKVRAAFLEIAAAAPDRCVVLNAGQPADQVLAAAIREIDRRFRVFA